MAWTMSAWALNAGRRFDEAEPLLRRALELNHRHGLAQWNLAICLSGQDRHDEAVDVLEHSDEGDRDGQSLVIGMMAWAKAVAGRRDEARRQLDELLDSAKHRHIPRYTVRAGARQNTYAGGRES